jgi:hypothetical protein
MKKIFSKKGVIVLSLVLALFSTLYLYWPIWQKITLNNTESNQNDNVIKGLELPDFLIKSDDIRNELNKKINLPFNRYELCLENKNRVYLKHSDSYKTGINFQTEDMGQDKLFKESKIGAMAINLYYDGLPTDTNYREIGQPKLCITLNDKKLQHYASSTIQYHHVGLDLSDEFDLKEKGKVTIIRSIIGGSFIDTSQSSASIRAQWPNFIWTFFGIWGTLNVVIGHWYRD